MSVITQDGDTALTEAAFQGRTEVVVELINSGATLDLQNNVSQGVISCGNDIHCTCTCVYMNVFSSSLEVVYIYRATYLSSY